MRRLKNVAVPSLLGKPMLAGTMELGYYGSFTSTEVITGASLASLARVTSGTLINSNTVWDGFAIGGKRLLIARLPIRHTVSWNVLSNANVVTGDKVVQIKGQAMRVRLLRGAATSPTNSPTDVDDPTATWGSEWNRLLYRLAATPSNGVSGEGIPFGEWAKLSDTALGLKDYWTFCQETHTASGSRVIRGAAGVRRISRIPPTAAISSTVWKPVLELVD